MNCWDLFGVCVEKKIDLGNAVLVVFALLGLLSIVFAYRQLKAGQRAQQTQIAIHLHEDFFGDHNLRAFLYRLDYSLSSGAWKFDAKLFPHSEDERHLDLLLYKFAFIGALVSNGDILVRDLQWLKVELAVVLENENVLSYLEWVQSPDQIPGHSSFSGAVQLFNALIGKSSPHYSRLNGYLERAR